MEGNVVGEPFEEFVRDQIKIRQSNQFGGYGTSLRTNNQLQYFNNRNAWVKLASSVDILEGIVPDPDIQPNTNEASNKKLDPNGGKFVASRFSNENSPQPQSQTQAPLSPGYINARSNKLRQIGIKNPEEYPGSKLAEKAVLFNTLSSYNPISKSYSSPRAGIPNNTDLWNDTFIYGIGGTDFGIQPPPGIIGVTVDSLNRGSIRKANVTLKAHNRFQFDIIELLYLRLGFTMMLEWGWDKYLDNETGTIQQIGNTIIEEKWFTSKNISQLRMLGFIQETREKYEGNYDGFFGKVSNFTWNFNPDGSYDISIDLITLGDVIESLKVNTVAKQKLGELTSFDDPTGITEELYGPNVTKVALLNSLGAFLFAKIDYMVNTAKTTGLTSNVGGIPSLSYVAIENKSKEKEKSEVLQKYFYYVRLGTFLGDLQNLIVPQIQNGDSTDPQLYISYDTYSNLVSYFPNQISFDPRVCIFQLSDSLNSYGDITGINSLFLGSAGLPLDPYLQVDQNGTYGLLMNLYINIEFLSELLAANGGPDQELSLFKFLQDLCNGINNALGGVNKLEPVIKDDSTIIIIDQTLSLPVEDSVDLEVYGYNPSNQISNFVKDVKFVSKITPQLASMISIGATAAGSSTSEIDGTAFSKWSKDLVDRFTQKILEPEVPPALPISGSANKEEYRKKYINFPDANPSIRQNFRKAFGIIEKDEVLKKVNDPYYKTLFTKTVDFNTFYIEAEKFDLEEKTKGRFRPGDLANLVDKNYGFYLANAFGGEARNIVIVDTVNYDPRSSTPKKTVTSPYIDPNKARYLEYNDTFISQGKAVYQNYIKTLNNDRFEAKGVASSEIGFIPLSFELTLDGISGIKIYNKLNINSEFLPSNYPESLSFIITKVNHNISNNSWETSLSTISIPVTEPYEHEVIPTSTNNGDVEKNENNVENENAASTPVSLFQNQEFKGQLQPLKNTVGAYESNNRYDIANIGGSAKISKTKVLDLPFSELKNFQTLPQGNPDRVFAAGKYQVIPDTLNIITKGLNLTPNDRFSAETQEKIGDYIFLNIRKNTGNYLSGKNSGTEVDLEKAIQGIGQEFASMPVIYSKTNQKVGDVRTGSGQVGFYGGTGANPSQSKLGVKEMARVLIQTRINYSNKAPVFIPIYFNL